MGCKLVICNVRASRFSIKLRRKIDDINRLFPDAYACMKRIGEVLGTEVSIRDANVILYMENGDIKEVGDHDTLIARGGKYADLYNSQFG